MSKHVVITAGPVYGRLDDNKLVSNRVRGIWALRFAGFLSARGHQVTLVLPDTMPKNSDLDLGSYSSGVPVRVRRHSGFDDYRAVCKELAVEADSMVLAAAVVNWIPEKPFPGKMPTKGYKVGDVLNVPFYLAPRVIEDMKWANPRLTLIGCKMLVGSAHEELISAAYDVLLKSRCNLVIANDQKALKQKHLVYKDRSVHTYANNFDAFYEAVRGVIEDEHWRTEMLDEVWSSELLRASNAEAVFDQIVATHRARFRPVEGGRVFGAVAVRSDHYHGAVWLCSPREKGAMFTSQDAVVVKALDHATRTVIACGGEKATLNAPLLLRFAQLFEHSAVMHFHDQVPGLPTLPYAPPGTTRDNLRDLYPTCRNGFNIEGHGCILPGTW